MSSSSPVMHPFAPPGVRIGTWSSAILLVYHAPIGIDAVTQIERVVRRHEAEHAGRIVIANAIDTTAVLPDLAARRAIAERLAPLADKVRAVGWVVDGGAFRRAAVQGALVGMRMFARRANLPALKVASTSSEVFAWFAARPELGITDAAAGAEALEAVRRDIPGRSGMRAVAR